MERVPHHEKVCRTVLPAAPRAGGRRARAGLPLAMVLVIPGCAAWHVQEGTPTQVVQAQTERVRVTTIDDRAFVLRRPRVEDLVLFGYDESCWASYGRGTDDCPELSFAPDEVKHLEFHEVGDRIRMAPDVVMGLAVLFITATLLVSG